MTSQTPMRISFILPLFTSLAALGCSNGPNDGAGTGGTPGSGGTVATGGTSSGGTATGGATGSGGSTTGGTSATGGASTGGGSTGGTPGTGGAATGGGSSGGTSSGGSASGGASSGGSSGSGGTAAGGGSGSGGGGGSIPDGGYPENLGAGCDVTAGDLDGGDKLPDPFAMNDGSRISSKAEWPCRRNEIKKDIEKYEIGTKQEPPDVSASMNDGTLNVVVTTSAGSLTLSSEVGMAQGAGPHCVAIGMNGNASLISGCVQVPFRHDQVVGYNQGSGSHNTSDPYYTVYPDQAGKIGKYVAWSWGISRLIDGLEQVKDELNIDTTRIGVQGCSYAGKMALFGGAFDERIALTVAQESGGGGINSWRTSQDFSTRTGTDIEKINNTNGSWFLQSMKALDPYSLPHDHHELIAMIAPRALIALGNKDYEWLGDESGWKSMNAAMEVWKAMGVEDHVGFDFTAGHGHCQAPQQQQDSVAAFVDKFLKGGNADTMIRIDPPAQGFDLDWTNAVDWTAPTLQ